MSSCGIKNVDPTLEALPHVLNNAAGELQYVGICRALLMTTKQNDKSIYARLR